MRLVALALFCAGGVAPVAAQVVDPGYVVQTIHTSTWSPPSPDPAGIGYRPETGQLMTCDSEVDEMAIFAGANVWTHSTTGVVSSTDVTTPAFNEPTGVAFDPAGGRLWISDDNAEVIYQVDLGPDDDYGTADDVVIDLDGLIGAGCDDLEDVTYDNVSNRLFVLSQAGNELCRIDPGANGVFEGLPPTGDDVATIIPLAGTGITSPRGIVYDPLWNSLVVADRGTFDLWELTPAGGVLRRIDVNFPSDSLRLSGVAIAPGSGNPVRRNYYVTDSRVDNGPDPNENDGRLFEVIAIPLGGNVAPSVDAGPSRTIVQPGAASLDGNVTDDGHPYPPGVVTSTWSKQSGPGSVTFGDASSPDTSASFSAPGSYVLALLGSDSSLSTTDTVAIQVNSSGGGSGCGIGPELLMLLPTLGWLYQRRRATR